MSARPPPRRAVPRGFTLLEVLVALAICAAALTFLFGAIAGSKDLTFRARQALARGDELRHLASLSLLVDESGELLLQPDSDFRIEVDAEELEVPERKTTESTEAIRRYDIVDDDGDVVFRGLYRMTLEEAE